MRVIVIRQQAHNVLAVVRIPDGSDGQATFERWAADPSMRQFLDEDALAAARWEEVQVIELA